MSYLGTGKFRGVRVAPGETPETWLALRGVEAVWGGNIDLDTWELQTGGLAGLQGSIFPGQLLEPQRVRTS